MKRLMLTLMAVAAIAAAAGPLPGDSPAVAQDGRRGDRWEQRGDRGGGREYRAPNRGRGQERGPDRGSSRGQGRGDEYRDGPRRDYDDGPPGRRGYESAPARRGGYMPDYRGGVVEDPGRYRLRPAPRGYSWVRTGNGYALVSRETGQVFDVIPD